MNERFAVPPQVWNRRLRAGLPLDRRRTIDARVPLGLPEPGSRVPPGTAPARVHTEIGCPAPIVDAGGYLAHINCVAVAVPLGRGQVAAVTTLVAGQHPPLGLSAATRAAGTRIAVLLGMLPA